MKKIVFFALAASLIASASFAQDATKQKTGWGFKLGLNGSQIRVANAIDAGWKTGLVAGFFVNFNAGDNFSIQPEFLYSSMGGKNLSEDGSSLRLNYFSLPVLAQYKLMQGLSVLAGPQLDVMIQAKNKTTSGFSKVSSSYKEDSYNLTAGIGLQPTHCFGFTLRYIYGLNNISAASSMNMKNEGLQLTAAVNL